MRVFAISDIHIDFEENWLWLKSLSAFDYTNDVLILAGDIADSLKLIEKAFEHLKKRFSKVFYTTGNHDLWVIRSKAEDSFVKWRQVMNLADQCEIITEPLVLDKRLTIVPLFGWYDYSFGLPDYSLRSKWTDYSACIWPKGFDEKKITEHFIDKNSQFLDNRYPGTVISFSHFIPRIDVMPNFIPLSRREIYPVMGTYKLEQQIREIGSKIHIYGHSHLNNQTVLDNVTYINNALGYPRESNISYRSLKRIF